MLFPSIEFYVNYCVKGDEMNGRKYKGIHQRNIGLICGTETGIVRRVCRLPDIGDLEAGVFGNNICVREGRFNGSVQ